MTLVRTEGSTYRRPGARMLVLPGCQTIGTISGGCLEPQVAREAFEATRAGGAAARAVLTIDNSADEDAWGPASGCHGRLTLLAERFAPGERCGPLEMLAEVRRTHRAAVRACYFEPGTSGEWAPARDFSDMPRWRAEIATTAANGASRWVEHEGVAGFLEVMAPPPHLLLFGAGNDAQPVARLAAELGWAVSVVDSRTRLATAERFPTAETVSAEGPDAVPPRLRAHTAAVLMSHRFADDAAALAHLLPRNLPYIGLLGPRRRTLRLLDHLRSLGDDATGAQLAAVRSPIGLDLGAASPETIALAIVAEIQAALAQRIPTPLHARTGPLALPAQLPAAAP